MSNTAPSNTGMTVRIVLVAVIVIALFAVKPAKIAYHRSALQKAWSQTVSAGGTNTAEILQFERHREALVKLGYLTRQTFSLAQFKPASPELRPIFDALSAHASAGHGIFAMQGFETNTEPSVTVWSAPGEMSGWESMIKAQAKSKP